MGDKIVEVLPRTQGMAVQDGVELDGKKYKWGKQGAFHLNDVGAGRALQQKYQGQILTMEVDKPKKQEDALHTYTHVVPRIPWHKYDENGNRIE